MAPNPYDYKSAVEYHAARLEWRLGRGEIHNALPALKRVKAAEKNLVEMRKIGERAFTIGMARSAAKRIEDAEKKLELSHRELGITP